MEISNQKKDLKELENEREEMEILTKPILKLWMRRGMLRMKMRKMKEKRRKRILIRQRRKLKLGKARMRSKRTNQSNFKKDRSL